MISQSPIIDIDGASRIETRRTFVVRVERTGSFSSRAPRSAAIERI